MKYLLLSLVITFAANIPARADGPDGNWNLVFSDEFNYSGAPDPTKWDYEEGYVRNKEKQYYTRARLENARVENGCLVLECRKEPFETRTGGVAQYTSASLFPKGSPGWLYGRLEVRAKLPQGNGVWPAVWLLGSNIKRVGWPSCGEIDLMEFIGRIPDKVYFSLHYRNPSDGKHKQDHFELVTQTASTDFHTYAFEWFPDHIDYFFDGVKSRSDKLDQAGTGPTNPFRRPQKLLINFALGGAWSGDVDDSKLPQQYLVDYVRYYQAKAGP